MSLVLWMYMKLLLDLAAILKHADAALHQREKSRPDSLSVAPCSFFMKSRVLGSVSSLSMQPV